MTAVLLAYAAAYAVIEVYAWLRRGMKFELSADARRTHAEVLEGSAEAALLMTLEVVHGNDYIRISDCGTDLRRRTVFSTAWNFLIVSTFKTIGDDYVRMGSYPVEAILHGRVEMVHRI